MRWIDDAPVKRRRKRHKSPSVTVAIAAAILLASVTLCGLLVINMPKTHTQVAEASVTTEILSDEADTEIRSDGKYSVKETESLNDTGEVTNKNTESKMMENLMYTIAKQTVRQK